MSAEGEVADGAVVIPVVLGPGLRLVIADDVEVPLAVVAVLPGVAVAGDPVPGIAQILDGVVLLRVGVVPPVVEALLLGVVLVGAVEFVPAQLKLAHVVLVPVVLGPGHHVIAADDVDVLAAVRAPVPLEVVAGDLVLPVVQGDDLVVLVQVSLVIPVEGPLVVLGVGVVAGVHVAAELELADAILVPVAIGPGLVVALDDVEIGAAVRAPLPGVVMAGDLVLRVAQAHDRVGLPILGVLPVVEGALILDGVGVGAGLGVVGGLEGRRLRI